MVRVLALGSTKWCDTRRVLTALRSVMAIYRDPYVLVCDMTDGAARFAAAGARSLGWRVDAHEFDPAKCAADCPPDNHRRKGGPTGDWCPAAYRRNLAEMLDGDRIDLCLSLVRSGAKYDHGERRGQADVRRRDIGIWTVEQPWGRKAGDGDGD